MARPSVSRAGPGYVIRTLDMEMSRTDYGEETVNLDLQVILRQEIDRATAPADVIAAEIGDHVKNCMRQIFGLGMDYGEPSREERMMRRSTDDQPPQGQLNIPPGKRKLIVDGGTK